MEKLQLKRCDWNIYKHQLKPTIEQVGIKGNSPNIYKIIDEACSNEWAFLFLSPDGFVILRPRHSKVTYLELLFAYNKSTNSLSTYTPALVSIAHSINAEYLEFITFRKGMNRVAVRENWSICGTIDNSTIWRYYLRTDNE
jgi:hypothetical protein